MGRVALQRLREKDVEPLDTSLFRRKMGGRIYVKAVEALEDLDEALQLDHAAVSEAAWYNIAARVLYKLKQDDAAEQCEQMRDEAITKALLLGPMREKRKKP